MIVPAIQVGERVRHRRFPACGIGKVVEILGDGKVRVRVRFPDTGHTVVGVEGFVFIVLRAEVWAGSADGEEVSIQDDAELEMALYAVDFGAWKCRFDDFGVAKERNLDGQMEAVK